MEYAEIDELVIKLIVAQDLLYLLSEHIEDMYEAHEKKDAEMAQACCARANLQDSLCFHVQEDIEKVKESLISIEDYVCVGDKNNAGSKEHL